MQEAEFRIDISYDGIKRIGATCCIGGDDEVGGWIMDEMGPVLKKYMERSDITDIERLPNSSQDSPERGRNSIRITGPLHLPLEANAEKIFADIRRKLTIVLDSKGLEEDKEFCIQFGLGRYDPDGYK